MLSAQSYRAKLLHLFLLFFLLPVLLVVWLSNPPTIHAQTQDSYTNQDLNTNPDVPNNQHTFVQTVTIEVLASVNCLLTGVDIVDPKSGCLGINPTTHKIGFVKPKYDARGKMQVGGGIGLLTGMIAQLYTPPVSTGDYVQYYAQNFGFKHVFADEPTQQQKDTAVSQVSKNGYGFESIRPFLKVFNLTRNIAYTIFVLAFIIIGIAIMLRVKIDPRTVMTIQNQIPRIIIGIILITFSYAIVGVLIDTMWVLTYVSINTLSDLTEVRNGSTVSIIDVKEATTRVTDNPISYSSHVIGNLNIILDVGKSIGTIVSDVIATAIGVGSWTDNECSGGFFGIIGNLGSCAEAGFILLIRVVATGIGMLIIAIGLFITLFRIWFMLIKAFAMVVLDTIAAPLWIAGGLFPGSKISFGSWFRHLVANILLFPATVTMFLLAKLLFESFNPAILGHSLAPGEIPAFVPPLIGNVKVAENFGVIIAYGVILMIPDLLSMLRDALKSPPSNYSGHFRSRLMSGNPISALPGMAAWGYNMQYAKNIPFVGGIAGLAGKFRRGGDAKAEIPGGQPPTKGP